MKELIDMADVILYLVDGASKESIIDKSIHSNEKTILVYTKRDLKQREGLSISTITGEGITELFEAIINKTSASLLISDDSKVIVESERQHTLLLESLVSLNEAVALQKQDIGLDIVAVEINSALTSLGGLTGEITQDDVLDKIFGDFCVGK